MAKKKKRGKKPSGHYCRICGGRKANEQFSGKGHTKHICKACDALPQERKNELQRIECIGRISEKHSKSRQDWELLEKYAKSDKYTESKEFAQMILGMSRNQLTEDDELEDWDEEEWDELFSDESIPTYTFSALDPDLKENITYEIYHRIEDFIRRRKYIPEEKDKEYMLGAICHDVTLEYGEGLMLNNELGTLFDKEQKIAIKELKKRGLNPVSYHEYITVFETDRLQIRKFTSDDLPDLHAIMLKHEVMYAWEHGFSYNETRKWLNRQLGRYKKDGYGYFALTFKETGGLIGQVGLMKSEINGKEVVELGYMIDNQYWGQGFCLEAVTQCVNHAFTTLNLQSLYCSIRPENQSSIRIAEKIGMIKTSEHLVNYKGQDMLHYVYVLEA